MNYCNANGRNRIFLIDSKGPITKTKSERIREIYDHDHSEMK